MSNSCYPYVSGFSRKTGVCAISKHALYSIPSQINCISRIYVNTIFRLTPPYRISVREEDIRTGRLISI